MFYTSIIGTMRDRVVNETVVIYNHGKLKVKLLAASTSYQEINKGWVKLMGYLGYRDLFETKFEKSRFHLSKKPLLKVKK